MVCAEPLAAAPRSREERKVVSILFVDLVGFTAASEASDPEDVRARLQGYHARAKHEVERFGGTVEKFVGDAVMAGFGAPVAHEDDAERAVRAGLAILEAVGELGLEARAGVNTGEAVVALEARPELGEGFVTGDVVNTAARLQSAAPVGGLVVGEQTYWATRHAIELEELEPVLAKGKAEPVKAWRAIRARSRFGVDVEPARETPFLGRDDELEVLRQVYARMLRESSCHLVTLVGEPGIGKSRLVAELSAFVDGREELVFWRQGRCLPYGDGIALWALGEIVKAHAGILESDSPEEARSKLAATLEPLVASLEERAWIASELARIVGAGESGAGREESFAAWRTFLEAVAAQRPLVLVVEDLHWADRTLLDFLEHLVDWSSTVPLLVLCTARPELYELNPTWGGGTRNATTISLSPLSSDDTAQLIGALLERSVLPAATQQRLLERAGGNPLYAEQFVRMLEERPAGTEVHVPETVQALIAARLDTLGPERKALLQDASVLGKVFWASAVAAVGDEDEAAVRTGLHELVRRELIRPSRLSSVEGQTEMAFGHALVRDVAYAQIPRADRVRKHEAAARWLEATAGDRVAEYSELLAAHYRQARRLALAAGLDAPSLETELRRALRLAAARATFTDQARADALYAEALALTPPGHPARGPLLTDAVEFSDDPIETDLARLAEAIEELERAGDEVGLGRALIIQSHRLWLAGDPQSNDLLLRSLDLLERHSPGPELAHGYVFMAGRSAIGGEAVEALEWAEKARELAEKLGQEDYVQRARQFTGIARCRLGDRAGIVDLREALAASLERGLTSAATMGYDNYASFLWLDAGAEAALPVYDEGIDFVRRRGSETSGQWHRAERTWVQFDLGLWDDVLETARDLAEKTHGQPALIAQATAARVLFYRGRLMEATALSADLVPRARAAKDPQVLIPVLSCAALLERDPGSVRTLVEEVFAATDSNGGPMYPDVARVSARHGLLDLLEQVARPRPEAWKRAAGIVATAAAILAETQGDLESAARRYREAAEGWRSYPFVLERAHCLLGLARTTADPDAAAEAEALFASLGAGELARQAEAAA